MKKITTEEFDRIFDEGKEDILQYMDMSTLRRPGLEPKRVNVDFPTWMVDRLDRESARLGITRQAVIKTWIADRLKAEEAASPQLRKAAVAQEDYLQEQQLPIRK